jgi:intracellular septation protein
MHTDPAEHKTAAGSALANGNGNGNNNGKALLRFALEMGPLITFFGVYLFFGIMAATAVFMAAVVVALTASYWWERRIAPMPLVSGVVVMVFGALTLYLDDALFIKLKPTIVNTLFGSILLIGLALKRPFLKMLFQQAFQLTADGWRILTLRWSFFFFFLAILNEVIWRNFSESFWVAFKVWGVLPITLVFAALQVPLLMKHMPPEARAALESRDRPRKEEDESPAGTTKSPDGEATRP